MSFVMKKSLERRVLLRGMGATLALPFLDAMVPALSAVTFRSTPRLGFIYIANGVIQDQWIRRHHTMKEHDAHDGKSAGGGRRKGIFRLCIQA